MKSAEQTDALNSHASGTFGTAPASALRAGVTPEASRDRSLETLGKKHDRDVSLYQSHIET